MSVRALVWILIGGYLLLCLFVFFRQRQMLYFPGQAGEVQMVDDAKRLGFLRWLDKGGQAIGWRIPGDAGGPPLLILQGNAGNALGRAGMVQRLRAAGIGVDVFVLDYPGFGSRAGTPTEQSLTEAALSALDALPDPPVILGESLGSGVAAQVAARAGARLRGLILLTPFDSIVAVARHHYPWLPVTLLVADRFDSVQALRDFTQPVAVIVGGKDATTPPAGAMRLFESLKAPKQLWTVPDADHNEPLWDLTDAQWQDVWTFVTGGSGQ